MDISSGLFVAMNASRHNFQWRTIAAAFRLKR